MNDTLKKLISLLVAVAALGVAYYGSYLPLQKSQMFINAIRNLSSVRTLKDFESSFAAALDAPSPVGQEELVRNTGNTIVNVLQQSPANANLVASLTQYLENYYAPIITKPRGLNFTQDFYVLGAVYDLAFQKVGDKSYLQKAQDYYTRGLALSPKRPQFLYGLLQIYLEENDLANAKSVAEKILSLWPDDEKTKATLAQIESHLGK